MAGTIDPSCTGDEGSKMFDAVGVPSQGGRGDSPFRSPSVLKGKSRAGSPDVIPRRTPTNVPNLEFQGLNESSATK